MEHDRINFKVFKWSIKKANGRIKNWSYRICEMLKAQNALMHEKSRVPQMQDP
jgi:hypothetical protein